MTGYQSSDQSRMRGRNLLVAAAACIALSGCSGARAFGSGALTPLDDLNLRRDEIPAVLVDASADPYGARNMSRCNGIAWEVAALNEALGTDMDEPPLPDAGWGDRVAGAAGEMTVGLLIDAATDFIPVRDWVRQLSGAEQHSRAVQGAIQNGRVRRAFLKGSGMRMNCAPPAAPSWFEPRQDGGRRFRVAERRPEPRPRYVPPPWVRRY